MSPLELARLAVIASHLSGYSLPDESPPAIREVTTRQMHDIRCAAGAPADDPCRNVIGTYEDGGSVIWIDTEFLQLPGVILTESAVVVHELVHWLQYEHGWGGYHCPHLRAREMQAYRIQNQYMEQYEHRRGTEDVPADLCVTERI